MKRNAPERITRILGLGLDNSDGHVRITTGRNFDIVLGSEETHGRMQELCIRLNEKLDRKGKSLDGISRQELFDLLSGAE